MQKLANFDLREASGRSIDNFNFVHEGKHVKKFKTLALLLHIINYELKKFN